jgi:hypothetical protein
LQWCAVGKDATASSTRTFHIISGKRFAYSIVFCLWSTKNKGKKGKKAQLKKNEIDKNTTQSLPYTPMREAASRKMYNKDSLL